MQEEGWTGWKMRIMTLCCIMLLCVSCATLEADRAKLRSVTVDDLNAALAIAQKHDDKAGVQCYQYLLTRLQSQDALLPVKGLVSAFEAARVVAEKVDAGVSEELNLACAALVNDAASTIARLASRFGL